MTDKLFTIFGCFTVFLLCLCCLYAIDCSYQKDKIAIENGYSQHYDNSGNILWKKDCSK